MHFVTAAHQLAWMQYPAIWLCESCAILWLVLRVVRSPLVRTGVLVMLCGLGMNALVTDSNAGSMPVVGMPPTVRPASPMWQGATLQTRLPLLADQARLGLFSIGDITLLFGGVLIVAICLRRTMERARQDLHPTHDAPQPSTIYDLALTGNLAPGRQTPEKAPGLPLGSAGFVSTEKDSATATFAHQSPVSS